MALNPWQKITRILPGMPFGDGVDGNYSGGLPSLNNKSCSATASSSTLTASTSSPYSMGDIVLIHQSRGAGVGQWEINRITAVGSGQYTLQEPLQYTFTDSGDSQAQVIKIFRYANATQSGTWTPSVWDGNTGGIFAIAVKGKFSVEGTISLNSAGYRGATSVFHAGEGTAGPQLSGGNPNASGGGRGAGSSGGDTYDATGSGGGGHRVSGSDGGAGSGNPSIGIGGTASGNVEMTLATFGGGSGTGGARNENFVSGVAGGGIAFVFAKELEVTGGINLLGQNGIQAATGRAGGSGGGAGGGFHAQVMNGSFGTSLLNASGGTGGAGKDGGGAGGNGSQGRIAIHRSGNVIGSPTPSASVNFFFDGTLVEAGGGILSLM